VRGGGAYPSRLYAVDVDNVNAVVAAGQFSGSSSTFGGVVLDAAGSGDAMVWKLSAEGTTLWAVSVGNYNINLKCVAVDGKNAVVAAGSFGPSSATFGGMTLGSAGGSDAVLWKLSAEGTTLWAVRGGGRDSDKVQALAVDSANAVVAAVNFYSSTATFGGVAVTNAGGEDAALWKLSGEGTALWAMRSNGTLIGVDVDGANAVVATGYFKSSMAMFGDVALTTAGGYDAFLWKLSAEGTTLWAVRGGGTSWDRLKGVAVDSANAVVAAVQFFSSPATFGGVELTAAWIGDTALWKLSGEGTTLW